MGFLLSVLLGAIWAAVGSSVAAARKKGVPIWHFYAAAAFGAACLSWLLWLTDSSESEIIPELLLFLLPAAVLNALCQALTMYNMKSSATTLAFSLPQLNFVMPFLFMVTFYDERITPFSAVGLLLIICSILFSGSNKKTDEDSPLMRPKEILLALAAVLLGGASQTFLAVSTVAAAAPPLLKSAVLLTANFCTYAIGVLFSGRKEFAVKELIKCSSSWSILATLSYIVLFKALEIMSKSGTTGIIFAVAGACSIICFWGSSLILFRDKCSLRQIIVLVMIICGTIAVRMA